MTSVSTRVIADAEEFELLVGIWDGLLQETGEENSVYLTHDWLATWWRHFGEGKKLNILLFEKQGRVIGAVPLVRTEYKIGPVKTRFLETAGVVSCNYVWVVPPEYRAEVATSFRAYLEEALARNRLVLRLCQVPEGSEFRAQLNRRQAEFPGGLAVEEAAMTLSLYILLPATWDEYYQSLSRNMRMNMRRASRALEEAHGVEIQECTADNLEEGLNRFFDLHQRRWRSLGSRRWFSNPQMRGFYRDIAGRFSQKKWLYLSCLSIDNEVADIQYCFIYNRKFYSVAVARDTSYSEYSVGRLHHMHTIGDAIERGLREFDFSRGDEPHKFHWTKSARRCMEIMISKRGTCLGCRLILLRIFLRLCEIRQNGLRESYRLRLEKKKKERLRRMMGLAETLK
ncbi:GNAT family N-acetyltransferase [Chloroflexota bacterium]